MSVLNRAFRVLSWIVVVAIAAYVVIAAPLILGYRPVVVLSGSMEPTYSVGSIIYYRDCEFSELQEGDPITFRAGESLVTHRIVTVNGLSETVITKGDNNETDDPEPVAAEAIVGKATSFDIPYAGYYVSYGKKPSMIIMMALILIINYLFDKLFSPNSGKKGSESHE